MKTREDLKLLIESSNLSDDDKTLWNVIDTLPDDQIKILIDFIGIDVERLVFLTTNLRMKQQFSKTADPILLKKMVKTTEEYLQKLAE